MRGVIARRALALLAGALLLAGCGSGSGRPGSSSSDTTSTEAPATTTADATTDAATTQAPGGISIKAIDPSKFLRGSSVGFGEGPAPSFAPAVKKAAARAGCRLRADPSAVGIHLIVSDIVPLHVDNPDYSKVPRPPTNGHHRPLWANWGFYRTPSPTPTRSTTSSTAASSSTSASRSPSRPGTKRAAAVGGLAAVPARRPRPLARRAARAERPSRAGSAR